MQASQIKAGNNLPDISVIEKCYEMIADSFDPVWGGFGQAPKFPQPGKRKKNKIFSLKKIFDFFSFNFNFIFNYFISKIFFSQF